MILIKSDLFPLVVTRDDWEIYIDALEAADEEDLSALVTLFTRLQKRDLTKAIVHAAEAKPVSTVDEAVAVTKDVLAGLKKLRSVELEARALQLRQLARSTLAETAAKLERELGGPTLRFVANSSAADPNATLTIEAGQVASKIVVEFGTSVLGGLALVGAKFQARGRSTPLLGEVFRIDYHEPMDELRERFAKWLDDCLIRGLAEWRKTLV